MSATECDAAKELTATVFGFGRNLLKGVDMSGSRASEGDGGEREGTKGYLYSAGTPEPTLKIRSGGTFRQRRELPR